MRIKAIFTGENGSLGYQTGKRYLLDVSYVKGLSKYPEILIKPVNSAIAVQDKSILPCPYSSIETFLQNWDNIHVITKKP